MSLVNEPVHVIEESPLFHVLPQNHTDTLVQGV